MSYDGLDERRVDEQPAELLGVAGGEQLPRQLLDRARRARVAGEQGREPAVHRGRVGQVAALRGGLHLVERQPQPATEVADQAARRELQLRQRTPRAVAEQVEQLGLREAGAGGGERTQHRAHQAGPVELVVALVAVDHDLDEARQVGRREQRVAAAAAA